MTLKIWAAGRGNLEPDVGTHEALKLRPTRHFYIIEYIVTYLWKFQQKYIGNSVWILTFQSSGGETGAIGSHRVTGAEKLVLLRLRTVDKDS